MTAEQQISNQQSAIRNYYFAIGRLVPYKRFDLLIEMANERRLPLLIGGTGSDFDRLKRMAGPTVTMLGYVPEKRLPGLYAGATALLFPQVEDAGIVPMEAMACGTPVIAYGKGGAIDVIAGGRTGLLVAEQTADAFAHAVGESQNIPWDRAVIREHARQFSRWAFKTRIANAVHEAYDRIRISSASLA